MQPRSLMSQISKHDGLQQVVKYIYPKISYLFNCKTNTITASTCNFDFVLLNILEGINKIREMIESL